VKNEEPRQNDRLLMMVRRSYEKSLFVGDKGMWTIFEIVRRPIAQAPSEQAAINLIKALEAGDGQ
jgi:hypothetical protein